MIVSKNSLRTRRTSVGWKEGRRLRALQLHRKGWKNTQIAEALGVSKAAVGQWLAVVVEQGRSGLRTKSRQGQGKRLSESQMRELGVLLHRGAEAFGVEGHFWTCRRISTIIENYFGIYYHPSHVSCLLHSHHWSYQKPVLQTSGICAHLTR